MDAWAWILIAVVVVIVVAVAALVFERRRRRRQMLRERFGPEYDRSLESLRSRRKAEDELAERAVRRDELEIRPLTDSARERYQAQWGQLQSRFVDRPVVAVVDADEVCAQVMRERGYPVDDFEARSDLMSVDHPDVVQNYRKGHTIYAKTISGEASTEDLRQAVVAYRALFEDLLADGARSREDEHAPPEDEHAPPEDEHTRS
jgi:hypothetical protein